MAEPSRPAAGDRAAPGLPRGTRLTALLTAMAALGPLATSIYLPSLPSVGRDLGATDAAVQLTFTLFLVGYGGAQLVFGPMSDAWGRRRMMLAGIVIFGVASIGCALAVTVAQLILLRAVQAVGACAGPVMTRAVVRDVYPPERAAGVFAVVNTALAIAPAIAPIVGGYVEVLIGWRANFAILAILALALLALVAVWLPETNAHRDPQALQPARLLASYRAVLSHRGYLVHLCTGTFAFAAMFAYIAGAPFAWIDLLRVRPDHYGLYSVGPVAAYAAGSMLAGPLARRVGVDRGAAIGALVSAGGGLVFGGLILLGHLSVVGILAPIMVVIMGGGIIITHTAAGAMAPFATRAGAASAMLGFAQMAGGALGTVLVAVLEDGSARPMAWGVVVASLLTITVPALVRGRKARP
jgi:DHA1 family bicyclomycin/chloramphenicol resistance-like MFS transporter